MNWFVLHRVAQSVILHILANAVPPPPEGMTDTDIHQNISAIKIFKRKMMENRDLAKCKTFRRYAIVYCEIIALCAGRCFGRYRF